MNATKSEVIESRLIEGAYGILCRQAIINQHKHGRLFISEGFGGMNSMEGGDYRWRHGMAVRARAADTLERSEERRVGKECRL